MKRPITQILFFLSIFSSLVVGARADVVETRNGAKLVGKIIKIDGKAVVLNTDYAGKLVINQVEVSGITMEEEQMVRLTDGAVITGVLTSQPGGQVEVSGQAGTKVVAVGDITATWVPGSKDPALAALEHKWRFEAAADISGKTGNREQFGSVLSARAKRTGPHDALQFYSSYKYQNSNGRTSADQFKAGIDYANNFAGRKSWYSRDELGFARVKNIAFFNLAATGLGYDVINETKQMLTLRAGLSHRYESYNKPTTPTLSSLGLDVGLHHEYTFSDSKIVNDLTVVPAFSDFSNFNATYESYFEIPLATAQWKLRLGVSNEYNSVTGARVDKLDTTYFTRFVLNWQ